MRGDALMSDRLVSKYAGDMYDILVATVEPRYGCGVDHINIIARSVVTCGLC